ncbi:MAG: glycosyltransferase [Chitinophagaceae bacterium]|nr:glycosyltransferase [Chitinophagaceae bacterium]
MDLSIIIPLYNEAESLPELFEAIKIVMTEHQFSYEIICVDDGSKDNSWEVIKSEAEKNNNIHGIKFLRNNGKSAALNEGFKAAKGHYVLTMDADLQDNPNEIPEFVEMMKNQKFDLISGWKKKRFDNAFTKNIPSKIYNYVTGKLSGVKLHDMNCGMKIYRHKVIKSIEVYGEMHRYIPVLAKWSGFTKIGEKVILHQARKYGVSKFGLERFINGFLDLFSVLFVSKYGKKPMHIFGFWGTLLFIFGFVTTLYAIFSKFYFGTPLTNSPIFYIALTTMVLGTQFFLAGFLGELISRNSSERNHYLIDETF